jgi:UDP-glucose:(heptosyl)LPS alpha-1,3-glucosyltransferase
MRIALATWSYDHYQGISRCVVELASRLARAHEVHVYAAETPAAACPGVAVHRVALRFPQVHINDYDFALRAGRLIRGSRFDIVHAHFPVFSPVDVYTCHGLARMALRSFRRFPPAARADVPLLRMLRWYLQLPLHRYAVRRPGPRLAAVSRKVALELAEESRRGTAAIEVVPNAVDTARFAPPVRAALRAAARANLGLAGERFVLLWVGNHLRHKGIRYALETLLGLPERAMLLAVGADGPASVPELAPAIERLRARDRLRFLPVEPDIERHYAAADALLFPSLYESFGLVVLEAMAMGLPVITAASVGFAAEAVIDGENGFKVGEPWDVAGLTARAAGLLASPALADAIGQAARRTAERHTWEQYAQRYESLYRQVLADRARNRGHRYAA